MCKSEREMQTETGQKTQYLSRKEVAKILGVNARTVDRLIKEGQLKAVKLGNQKRSLVKIHKDALAAFLKSRSIS